MNKKRTKTFKWLIAPMSLTPLMTMVGVSCSHRDKYDDLAEPIQQDVLDYFVWICAYERPTFHTKSFCEVLESKIKQILGSDQEVIRGTDYKPIDPETGKEYVDHGWNMYTDIEPSIDGQNHPSTIIQCHTDMVWVCDDAHLKHPIMVYDVNEKGRPIIHTQNKISSLGADNGIGVATALALMKNKDTFTHGKIRFLFTTDEEDGDGGAKDVPVSWLYEDNDKQFDYLLNIDLEQIYSEAVSCGGVQQAKWAKDFTCIESTDWANGGWTINISGLKGGHSGEDIDSNRINAIKFGFELLGAISKDPNNQNIQLFRCSEKGNQATKPNAIPTDLSMSFACDYTVAGGGEEKIKSIIKPIIEVTKETHPDDADFEVEIMPWFFDSNQNSSPAGVLSTEDTKNIITFVEKLPYGVKERFPDMPVAKSCNLASIRLHDGNYSKEYPAGTLYVEMFGRSPILDMLGENPESKTPDKWGGFMLEFRNISNEIFPGDETPTKSLWIPKGWNPPWESKEENKIRDTIWEASQTFGYEMHKSNCIGWLEVAEFAQKTQGIMDLVAIGPTIYDAHTVNETIEVDTIIPMLKMVLYTLEKVPERRM